MTSSICIEEARLETMEELRGRLYELREFFKLTAVFF